MTGSEYSLAFSGFAFGFALATFLHVWLKHR